MDESDGASTPDTPGSAAGPSDEGDEADRRRGERESALRERETLVEAQEQDLARRRELTGRLLAAAEHRDHVADERDSAATARDSTASLRSFLRDEEYAAALGARRSAAGDRIHAKSDRDSAAEDRSALTDGAAADDPEAVPPADAPD